jgi:hypothetical protein
MAEKVNRQTVDLSSFPDLVVIYLGMRVNRLTGLKTLLGFGPRSPTLLRLNPADCFCMRMWSIHFFP